MRILIVEDEETILQFLSDYLCENNTCDTAKNVSEAVELISHNRYDLIVMDLLLGNQIGTEIIKRARQIWQDSPPKICIMSAMTGAKKIAEDNEVNFILKPFDLETLDKVIV